MTDRRKLTPPQRAALEVLAAAEDNRPVYLSNWTSRPMPGGGRAGATVHAGTVENLARRGLANVWYRHAVGQHHEARITPAGRDKLAGPQVIA